MDINNYITMKKKNCLTLKAFEDVLIIRCTRFDPNTGEKLDPQSQMLNWKEFKKQTSEQIKVLEAQLASLREFEADAEAVMSAAQDKSADAVGQKDANE